MWWTYIQMMSNSHLSLQLSTDVKCYMRNRWIGLYEKKKITICDCLALVPCRKFQAEELDWVQRNTCEPHVAQPRSPTKEILCLLDHRACPRAACCPQGCFLLRLSQVSEAPSPSGPLPQPPVWERRKRYILKEPKPFHREGHTTLTWEPSPNSRSPP